jgi:hypothetical protein
MKKCMALLLLLILTLAVAIYLYKNKPQRVELRLDPISNSVATVVAPGDVLVLPKGGVHWYFNDSPCAASEREAPDQCTIRPDVVKKNPYNFQCKTKVPCDPEIIPDDPNAGGLEGGTATTVAGSSTTVILIGCDPTTSAMQSTPFSGPTNTSVGSTINWRGNGGVATTWSVTLDSSSLCTSTTGGDNTVFKPGHDTCTQAVATFTYTIPAAGSCTKPGTGTIPPT